MINSTDDSNRKLVNYNFGEELPHKGRVAKAVAQTLKTSNHLESPFSAKSLAQRRFSPSVALNLMKRLEEPDQVLPDQGSADAIYGPSFTTPPNKEWHEFREAILLIEEAVAQCQPQASEISALRQAINALLAGNASTENKSAELALMHFYCERDRKIPSCLTPLLDCRVEEIYGELTNLGELAKTGIPTARQAYLFRALARLLLTEKGLVRPGGAICCQLLLEGRVGVVLHDEHRLHILNCVKRLITHPRFREVVNRKATLHRSMEEIVRLELKLKRDSRITEYHIKLALFLALFCDLRQEESDPNCYAVAPILAAVNWHPEEVYELLASLLSDGAMQLQNNSTKIPLLPLFLKRMETVASELNVGETGLNRPHDLPVTQAFLRFCGVTAVKEIKATSSLLSVLNELSEQAPYDPHLLLSSFWTSPLLQLLLAVTQFRSINQPSDEPLPLPIKFSFLKALKEKLQEAIFSKITSQKERGEVATILDALHKKMVNEFWIQDVLPQRVSIEPPSTLVVTYSDNVVKRELLDVDPQSVVQAFKAERRLFQLRQDRFIYFSKLPLFCKAWNEHLAKSLEPVRSSFGHESYQTVLDCIKPDNLSDQIAELLESANATYFPKITAQHYKKWEELLLSSPGGFGKSFLELLPSAGKANDMVFHFSFTTPVELLCQLLDAFAKGNQMSHPYILLTENHACLTLPTHTDFWMRQIGNGATVQDLIEVAIEEPLLDLREQMLTPADKEEILDIFFELLTEEEQEACTLLLQPASGVTKASVFFDAVLSKIDEKYRGLFRKACERYLMGISVDSFSVEEVLEHVLSKTTSPQMVTRIEQELKQALSQDFPLPHELAASLQRVVAEVGLGTYLASAFENAIYAACDLPATFLLIDPNWYLRCAFPTEQPIHTLWGLKPDIFTGELILVQRQRLYERVIKTSSLLTFGTAQHSWQLCYQEVN